MTPLTPSAGSAVGSRPLGSLSPDERRMASPSAAASSPAQGNTSVNSDEWHLSVAEESSLNFGDEDDSLMLSHRAEPASAPSTVRLVNPNSELEGSPRPTASLESSQNRMSSSSRSPRPPQVQFSPLSLAPSPLLGLPPLPPPPPPPPLSIAGDAQDGDDEVSPSALRTRKESLSSVKTILKAPRTPGTGQSVRFSSSTSSARDAATPTVRPGDATRLDDETWDQDRSSASFTEDEPSSAEEGTSSRFVASFLSRLQAVIPSPDSSIASVVSRLAGPGDQSAVEAADGCPAVAISSPTSSDFGERHSRRASSTVGLGIGQGRFESPDLFDESNPFAGVSLSILAASTANEVRPESTSTPSIGDRQLLPDAVVPASPPGVLHALASKLARSTPLTSGNQHSPASDPDWVRESPLQVAATDDSPESFRTAYTTFLDTPKVERDTAMAASSPSSCNDRTTGADPRPSDAEVHSCQDYPVRRDARAGEGSSLYRVFMQKRSEESRIAADEWGRLVSHGYEPNSRLQDSSTSALEDFSSSASAAPPSPQTLPRSGSTFPGDSNQPTTDVHSDVYEDSEQEQWGSFDAGRLRVAGEPAENSSCSPRLIADLEPNSSGPHFLSPIVEVSEPNTTVNSLSPFSPDSSEDSALHSLQMSPHPVPPTIGSLSAITSLVVDRPLVDSRIPRLRGSPSKHNRSASQPITATTALDGSTRGDLELVLSLLSTHDEWQQNASSQRFLLSSLVANLRAESERKDRVMAKLRQRNAELENGWHDAASMLEVASDALVNSEVAAHRDANSAKEQTRARVKLEALEVLVANLTAELEARNALQAHSRQERESEVAGWRGGLAKAQGIIRDGAIRLRLAQAGEADANDRHVLSTLRLEALEREKEILRRERDDVRTKWRQDVMERDRIIVELRGVIEHEDADRTGDANSARRSRQSPTSGYPADHEAQQSIDSLQRRLDARASEVEQLEARLRRAELSKALLGNELEQHCDASQVEHNAALAEVGRLESALAQSRDTNAELREALDNALNRLSSAEADLDRRSAEIQAKSDKLLLQTSAWEEHQAEMTQLMESIAQVEAEAAGNAHRLEAVQLELDRARHEAEEAIKARDQELRDTRLSLVAQTGQSNELAGECNRLKEVISNLRRQSMERESKYARLKKIRSNLEEDIFGLNIALEAKQQEASAWKRQAQSAHLLTAKTPGRSDHQTPTAVSTSRRVGTTLTNGATSRLHSTTEDTPSSRGLTRKPSLGFGSSARREAAAALRALPEAPTTRFAGAKENVAPRKRPASCEPGTSSTVAV